MELLRVSRPPSKSPAKGLFTLLRNLTSATVLYGVLYAFLHLYQSGTAQSLVPIIKAKAGGPAPMPKLPNVPQNLDGIPPRSMRLDKINPHANWYNRPASTVIAVDNYLGERPDPDTIANITKLVESCRGSYEKFEKMPYVFDCMEYLANGQGDYFYLPSPDALASKLDPAQSEYANMNKNYLASAPADKESIGACSGPIVLYHTYWAGPATWRVEVFVKSYLYTQNLPCSRLWIWLDCDKYPNAIQDMLKDPKFARLKPLVERGDITLQEWRFPSRIPMAPREDNTDGMGYYWPPPEFRNEAGERVIGDGLIEDIEGIEWLVLNDRQKSSLPVAISDAMRFIVLHLHGGSYYDMDVLMLRDMRPLLISPTNTHSFAERWGVHPRPSEFNTAIMSLSRNSPLSSYLVRGGVRMGMNFHPRVIGRMLVKDGIYAQGPEGFQMLETAPFDTIWNEFDSGRKGRCAIPCIRDYSQVFKGRSDIRGEWESFDGKPLPKIEEDLNAGKQIVAGGGIGSLTTFDRAGLRKTEYRVEEDNFPPTNRTLQNFFRGAWTYHIHNQWAKNPEPSSWLNVIQIAHNGFFKGERMNPYGEMWQGPAIVDYELSWEYT